MKKDLIFAPILAVFSLLLSLLNFTGMPAHIAISVLAAIVLVVYTAATKKEWKVPALEILMRVFYGLALISGIVIVAVSGIFVVAILHKLCATLFAIALLVMFVHKLIVTKKA